MDKNAVLMANNDLTRNKKYAIVLYCTHMDKVPDFPRNTGSRARFHRPGPIVHCFA